jgi:hypothetical protein
MRISLVAIAVLVASPRQAGLPTGGKLVPFVGCPADGQTGPVPPPSGTPKSVDLAAPLARAIAFYKGEQAPGVFAPRGWRCRVWYGSNGGFVVVSPATIDSAHIPPRGTRGAAVQLSATSGQTSGRFDVAFTAARLFPRVAADFIRRVRGEGLVPASEFPRGSYPDDRVTYVDSTVAEFTTPPGARGLGTEGYLQPSGRAVRGVAVLYLSNDGPPDLEVLRLRLPPGLNGLEVALLQLNRLCMLGRGPCSTPPPSQ